jgi:serine/threonine protein kinase/WD40 repeat protein
MPATVAPSESPPTSAEPVVVVPGYEILGRLGRGGMGVVYKARHKSLNRVIALKMILHAEHAGPEERERFRTEAQAVARLQHPHVVQIHDVGEHGGLPYLSLEFCGGGTLADRLRGGMLPPAGAARLMAKLAQAVAAAHRAGVVHRDLKPANVLLTADGIPKIADFGLAKLLDVEGRTLSGLPMGTPPYMSPEQASGRKDIGPPTDIYALGAILYELLTGRPPFKAATPIGTLWDVQNRPPTPPHRLNPAVPASLEVICLRCLEKDRERRYPTADALAEELGRFLAGQPIAQKGQGKRRAILVAGVLILALLLGLFAIRWRESLVDSPPSDTQPQVNAPNPDVPPIRPPAPQEPTDVPGNQGRTRPSIPPPVGLRDRQPCQLVVEAGGQQGTCNCLLFTRDGNKLLSAGDDKVVRTWQYRDWNIDPRRMQVLRWSAWREQRGNIYAMALSPDERYVAIGGYGLLTTSAAILDRLEGRQEVAWAILLQDKIHPRQDFGTVQAVAYSPSGKQVALGTSTGSIWTWAPTAPKDKELTLLGSDEPIPQGKHSPVRLVDFRDENTLLSITESGQVLQWDLRQADVRPKELSPFDKSIVPLFNAIISSDRKWLAVTSTAKRKVVVCSLKDNTPPREIPVDGIARSIAFSADGMQLAIALLTVVPGSPFPLCMEDDDRIFLYDLTQDPPALRAGLRHHGRADALAFHPTDRTCLAVAGGDNHEVTLWNLKKLTEPVEVVRGDGRGLWQVALSQDGKNLGFQDQRNSLATNPNARGSGAWRVFDLAGRTFWPQGKVSTFKPFSPLEELRGWTVQADRKDPHLWYAVHAKHGRCELRLDRDSDSMPRCYTFLPQPPGSQGVRLAVGHYYGVSVFELTPNGARRVWRGGGHQAEVMSVAPAPDGSWLVSASSDQTIAAWSLQDRGRSELGATFAIDKGRLHVTGVDFFSPAYEMGLTEDNKQEVVRLEYDRSPVYVGQGIGEEPIGTPEDALSRLCQPEPGKELALLVREANGEPVPMPTRVLRRPIWRLFPTCAPQNQWVIWLWAHHYYDTSSAGDKYIGWLINNAEGKDGLGKTPAFQRAEQLSAVYYQQELFENLLGRPPSEKSLQEALKVIKVEDRSGFTLPDFGLREPAAVQIVPAKKTIEDSDLGVQLRIAPRSTNPDYLPRRAELWVNDYRVKEWDLKDPALDTPWTIKSDSLRDGDNVLTLVCFNRIQGLGEGRSEAYAHVDCKRTRVNQRLFVLAVGVSDYSKAARRNDGKVLLSNLPSPDKDAQKVAEALRAPRVAGRYAERHIQWLPDKDGQTTRDNILAAFDRLARDEKVTADDHFVLFLSGHGCLQGKDDDRFLFCCGNFDQDRPDQTAISGQELCNRLARLPCRKTVFLDACHAGQTILPVQDLMPVRELTRSGQGPTILAACDRGQQTWENPNAPYGLFSHALVEALGDKFDDADANHDGQLSMQELFRYVQRRLPDLLEENRVAGEQTAVSFPAALGPTPVFGAGVQKKTASPQRTGLAR